MDKTINEPLRLQKYLAEQGVASRRAAEALILAGRVAVNGSVVTELGTKVAPGRDRVYLDGQLVAGGERKRYILLHKPAGYICSAHDQKGRRTVLDLLDGVTERVYPVGRLDYDTSGLLLLTNDGSLTHQLLHPSHQVDKTYLALVAGCPSPAVLTKLRQGIRLEDGMTAPAQARIIKTQGGNALVELVIHEGRNRQVRRMLEAVGYPVLHLKRSKLAFLDVKAIPLGQWRELSPAEIKRLKEV